MKAAVLIFVTLFCHQALAETFGPWTISPSKKWSKVERGPGCGVGPFHELYRNKDGNIWISFTYGWNAAAGMLKAKKLSVSGEGKLWGFQYVKCGFGADNCPIYVFGDLDAYISIVILRDGVDDIAEAIKNGALSPKAELLKARLAESNDFLGSAVSVSSKKQK